jgi:hypothetical protein
MRAKRLDFTDLSMDSKYDAYKYTNTNKINRLYIVLYSNFPTKSAQKYLTQIKVLCHHLKSDVSATYSPLYRFPTSKSLISNSIRKTLRITPKTETVNSNDSVTRKTDNGLKNKQIIHKNLSPGFLSSSTRPLRYRFVLTLKLNPR